METDNTIEMQYELSTLCKQYQEEYASGRWYITQTGLNKAAKLLGGKYNELSSTQKKEFRQHCVNSAQNQFDSVKTWWYYINL